MMDNDGIHKFAYGHEALFADLLHLAVPALAAELDLERAELLPTALVSAEGSRLNYPRMKEPSAGAARAERGARDYPRMKQRHGDLMWRVPRRRDASDDVPANLIVAAEFQSTVDKNMARRMRDYRRMLRESLQRGPLVPSRAQGVTLARKSPAVRRDGEDAPAVLPLLVYNGSERWTTPGAVTELPAWSPQAQRILAPFQDWDYVLLSLEQLLTEGDRRLGHLPLANRSAATLRLQMEETPADLVARLHTEWVRFPGAADRATRNVLHVWTDALLAKMGSAESTLPSVDELDGIEGPTGEEEMATVSEARFAAWFDEVRAEHVAQGIQQGVEQGVEQGIRQGVEQGVEQGIQRGVEQERARGLARLRRQAAIKFGAPTAERLAGLLGATIAAEQMERVGDWIMECNSSGDLLARVSTLRTNGGIGN